MKTTLFRSSTLAVPILLVLAWTPLSGVAGTVTNTADSGPGSLRQALDAATPGETITFAPSLAGQTILLTSGELILDRNLTIDASALTSPVTIDAGTATTPQRVLWIDEYAQIVIDSLVITGGHTVDATHPFEGKYRRNPNEEFEPGDGGGILNTGTLTVRNCVVRDNTTGRGGDLWLYGSPGGSGGGIHNEGTMIVEDSLITANTTGPGGNGIGGWRDGDCSNYYTNGNNCYYDHDDHPALTGLGGSGGPGAGICNTGSLTLRRTIISGNRSGPGGDGVDGPDEAYYNGDIEQTGNLSLYVDQNGNLVDFSDYYDSTRRFQAGGDGGLGGPGAGVANEGDLVVEQCRIEGNFTGDGGNGHEDGGGGGPGAGIFNEGGLQIEQCSIEANTTGRGGEGTDGAPGVGGRGAGLEHAKGNGLLSKSTIAGNLTAYGEKFGGSGAGMMVSGGNLVLRNSTIAGNQTGDGGFRGGSGAGVFHFLGDLTVEHCTISGNSTGDGGSYPGGVGGLYTQDGNLTVQNSIIAGNAAGMGDPDYERWQSDVDFEGNNQIGGDPGLAPLGFHGGPTRTMPPLPGSPVIDDGSALPGNPLEDQRGLSRPMGSGPDLGAVESGHPTGYDAWTADHLPNGSDTNFGADGNGDGISNALTYACGPDGAPTIAHSEHGMLISFGYLPSAQTDTVLKVLRSTDLITFTEVLRMVGDEPVLSEDCTLSGSLNRLILQDGGAPAGRAFYRIEVERIAP